MGSPTHFCRVGPKNFARLFRDQTFLPSFRSGGSRERKSALMARTAPLLGRDERSTPPEPGGSRRTARGVDGESQADRYETIKVETVGRVGLVYLHRPKNLNALNSRLSRELLRQARAVQSARRLRRQVRRVCRA